MVAVSPVMYRITLSDFSLGRGPFVKTTFISGVSSEFQSSRLQVRDDLLTADIHPVLQDHFGPQASTTCELLLAYVWLRIKELNIECRTRNVEIRSEGEQTDESHNKPIASDTSTSSTSALDIPCSTFDIQSTARELQSESESL